MRQATLFDIQQRTSMSATISKNDKDYALYAGASLDVAYEIAEYQTLIKAGMLENSGLITLHLLALEQKRKAFFGATASEISKLGWILGTLSKKSIKGTIEY